MAKFSNSLRSEAMAVPARWAIAAGFICLVGALFVSYAPLQAVTVITGPFASNGSYTLIPNGGFETGDMTNFGDFNAFLGVFRARTDNPLLG